MTVSSLFIKEFIDLLESWDADGVDEYPLVFWDEIQELRNRHEL